ncbi:hypothetical protein T07_12435 [Trichinella nelsoni]|uniref:Uncharacterized protein n=1 Tax=Trichinella nelsoni TaxID=6336 RepID=A0A0V0SBK5_9BILA|nr:hypothetical protein T07_12435 [Trichinella nelsoni]
MPFLLTKLQRTFHRHFFPHDINLKFQLKFQNMSFCKTADDSMISYQTASCNKKQFNLLNLQILTYFMRKTFRLLPLN